MQSINDAPTQMSQDMQSQMLFLASWRQQLRENKRAVAKEMHFKKKQDDRLLARAKRNLTPEMLLQMSREKKERGETSTSRSN